MGPFQATAGFQDLDFFQKATKMVLKCILMKDFFTFQDSNFSPVPPMKLCSEALLFPYFGAARMIQARSHRSDTILLHH